MEEDIEELFQNWNNLNKQVEESFGQFEFSSVKEVREKQRKIEDSIYATLLKNASEDLMNILPTDCGSLEIGYDTENKIFYFVMLDPKYEESEEIKLLAITIDSNKKVSLIEDFKE
ncbi:MAG: hypothetical protein ACFFDK_04160 [Promethearchaeota archaeon]